MAVAQYNTERLLNVGRSALYYEDYVLSIQYFNQIISLKPYLYEPWFYRGIAKFYLDDFIGAEQDCSAALERNPYVVGIYELRGLARIRQKKYPAAIDDYTVALRYDPENRSLWHNRVLCRIEDKQYEAALADLDTMTARWSSYASAYSLQAQVFLNQKDTLHAEAALERSAELDPYDGYTWGARSFIALAREQWTTAEEFLNKAIHLLPKHSGNYINRALARYNLNDLRGAMADYDTAIDLDPKNFIGHYNRGLLRAQVGDDNRAILDFDYVLGIEPDNTMALFNRAVLLDKTGDLRGAIRDYTAVIDQYPNFWTGLQHRASCYRRLGQTSKAEADEFAVYKARLYKHLYGTQPKMTKKQLRKRSDDDDPEKYSQLVVDDDNSIEQEYKNDYRGRVQNHQVKDEFLPMFSLSLEEEQSDVRPVFAYDSLLAAFNEQSPVYKLYVSTHPTISDTIASQRCFQLIDTLTAAINRSSVTADAVRLLLVRAIAYSALQNYEAAIDDLSNYLAIDSTSAIALWQRAYCQSRMNIFYASQGENVELRVANARGDLNRAIELAPNNSNLLFNRANLAAQATDYQGALADYDRAVAADASLPEAYYNRGLCHLKLNSKEAAVANLSKAGELGIYSAYSIIKRVLSKDSEPAKP